MSLRASLIWHDDIEAPEFAPLELASTIRLDVLKAVKDAALRDAEHLVASNIGDEVRELKFRIEYENLQKLLDHVLPERSRIRPPREAKE